MTIKASWHKQQRCDVLEPLFNFCWKAYIIGLKSFRWLHYVGRRLDVREKSRTRPARGRLVPGGSCVRLDCACWLYGSATSHKKFGRDGVWIYQPSLLSRFMNGEEGLVEITEREAMRFIAEHQRK